MDYELIVNAEKQRGQSRVFLWVFREARPIHACFYLLLNFTECWRLFFLTDFNCRDFGFGSFCSHDTANILIHIGLYFFILFMDSLWSLSF